MKNYPKVSLCISTYNWPQALELCLESVLSQTYKPFEIIIGDDGSAEETKTTIERLRKRFSIPILHIWQPDEGFKLAQIRNKSFAAASGEYIIQVDGDVILHKQFVEDHLSFAAKNVFLSGARSLLTADSTEKIFKKRSIENVASNYGLGKKYNALRNRIAARLNFHIAKGIHQTKYVLGANMSFWRNDLLAVNGYNEDYEGWGKEDNDLAIRLCNSGIKLHSLKFAGIIYHLKHNESLKGSYLKNKLLLEKAVKEKHTFVANGLDKYLK